MSNEYLEELMALDEMAGEANLSFGDEDDDVYGVEDVFGAVNPRKLALASLRDARARAAAIAARKRAAARPGAYAPRKPLLRSLPSAPGNLTRDRRLASQAIMPNYAQALEAARGDDVIFGLDSGSAGIGAGVTAALSASPQKRNLPTRITVTSNMANNFVCSDIRVGVEPILATTSNISLAVFIEDSTAPNFRAVVNEVGMDFTMELTNITGATARFVATVVGVYVPPWARPY